MSAASQPSSASVTGSWAQRMEAFRSAPLLNFSRSLPGFFIVGPPRTGTTWLHEILKRHVALPASTKETRFFDLHFHRGTDWYLSHYRDLHSWSRIGEVAPTYFASPEARTRIREMIPHAKIVCIFRDPVQRLVSLYRLKRAYGWISWTLEEAIERDPELTESGRYASHLKTWQRTFGADQILPTLFDDLRDRPQTFVDGVADFIGIPRFALTPADCRSIHASDFMTIPRNYACTRAARLMVEWLEARHFGPLLAVARNSRLRKLVLGGGAAFADIPSELSRMLYEFFREEVDQLELLLERDLSTWKTRPAVLYEKAV